PAFTADSPPRSTTAGTAYSYTFTASGAPAPTFAIDSGTLPPGVRLNPTNGVVSGTPTTAGTFTFTVQASNGDAPDAHSPPITIAVNPAGLDRLVMSPASASISAGGSQAYTAEGFDAYNNDLGDVTGQTAVSIGPGGSCDNTAHTCTATTAGTYTVTATDG